MTHTKLKQDLSNQKSALKYVLKYLYFVLGENVTVSDYHHVLYNVRKLENGG